jgi:hypothetical protein
MLREAKDESSAQYQRLRWDALRKSINGLINKVNVTNLKDVLPEIFGEVRSRPCSNISGGLLDVSMITIAAVTLCCAGTSTLTDGE